jgi:2-polyprenyl-3-methyl-5-hydroxy-6-metoxy-1,4-benzoquinol methylase
MAIPLAQRHPGRSTTLDYYDRHAEAYARTTQPIDLSMVHSKFAYYVRPTGLVLDVGSGSGRDTRALMRLGFRVEAIDASPKMAAMSSEFTGVVTRVVCIESLEDFGRYDALWVNAVLLHVPENGQADVLMRIRNSLKPRGIAYLSYKLGSGERTSADGRFFLDMNQSRFEGLAHAADFHIEEHWISLSTVENNVSWFNVIVRTRD